MSTPNLVISEPKPLRNITIVAILLLVTIVAQWLYNQSQNKTLFSQLDTLNSQLSELETAYNTLRQQFTDTQKSKRLVELQLSEQQQTNVIQQGTEQELQIQLNELQTQVMSLKKELMFYQNITQGNSSSKLQVRDTFISKTELPNIYRYRIVITQGKKVSKPITGKVKMSLKTKSADKETDIAEHNLNLRHIQVIEGSVNLAENTTPEAITIKITQSKKTRLNETVKWQISPH